MHTINHSRPVARRFGAPLSIAVISIAVLSLGGSADAKPRASSPAVHTVQACAVKGGKQRGSLRLVSAGKRCKRSERRITWSVLGPPGSQGAAGPAGSPGEKGQGSAGKEGSMGPEGKAGSEGPTGQQGQAGPTGVPGAPGAQGPAGTPAVVDLSLKELVETQGEQIETLSDSLESMTSLLQGVTNAQLLAAVDAGAKLNGIAGAEIEGAITNASKLSGITLAELNGAIATVPKVAALCTRTAALTSQANSLLSALGGISLGGLLPVGLELKIPALPSALGAFACP